MNTLFLIGFFLVLLGFVWGFWLIFKNKVTQPVQVIMYFIGAILAVLIAIFVTVRIFPGIAIRFLDMATTSPDVQALQQKTDQIFQSTTGSQPVPTTRPTLGPTAPVSPVAPSSSVGSQTVSPTAAPGQIVHVVQLGETLSSIARRYGVSAQSIQTLNKLSDPNSIKAGQKLLIPKP